MTGYNSLMRLGIVTGEYHPMRGGVGDYSRELALALCRHGHEVHLITHRGASFDPGFEHPAFLSLHPAVSKWSFRSLYQIRRLAQRLQVDLLSLQYQALAYGMIFPIHLLPRAVGRPVVVTFHDLRVPYLFPKAGAFRRKAVLALARSAAGVIATNSEDQQALLEAGGVEKLACIPIGSNFAVRPPAGYERESWRTALGLASGEKLVGFFGFATADKGVHTLASALQLLHARGLAVRLLLIGGGGTDAHVLAPLGRQVIKAGYLGPQEVSAHLLSCDVLALPFRQGVSLRSGSLMACLVHGCPVVTTEPASPHPELVNGQNLRLVPPEDPSARAEALEAILNSSELSSRLAAGAKALARKFDWDGIASDTAAFFESAPS